MNQSKSHLLRRLAFIAMMATGQMACADPVLSEVMPANRSTLKDETGAYTDWIEIYNPDATALNLSGWYLTDSQTDKTQWQFPAVAVPPRGYLVVFASGNNRRDPAKPLHTNFRLDADGEYLGLIKPDGVTVVSEFAPKYPKLDDDVSYGLVPNGSGGFTAAAILGKPTPGALNIAAVATTVTQKAIFSRTGGPFRTAFSVELSGASAGQQIRYVLISATSGKATDVPTSTSTLYSGAITVSTTTAIRAAVFSADGKLRGPVGEACYSRIGTNLTNFSSQLPVLVIDSLGSGALVQDDIDHPSWLYVYSPPAGNAPTFNATPGLISPMTATVRGASSALFPKKGYNIGFSDATGGDRSLGILDMPSNQKWALVNPWKYDLSFINNSFTYALSNQMGRWAPRTRLAEVFFNANGDDVDTQDYAGIYVITDKIEVDKDRVDISSLSPNNVSGTSVTGGYIFKIDSKLPGEIAWTTTRQIPADNSLSIIMVTPDEGSAVSAQVDYIKNYVQRMEDALFGDRATGWSRRTYLDYIDRSAWVDHHLLNVFVSNPDAFRRSAYFTKDRNGKLAAGPVWDFDRALGSYWDERSFRYDVWAGLGTPDPWRIDWWGVIATDPEFMQEWVDRWQSLRRSQLSNANLLSLVTSLGASVGSDAAARDAARWPDDASPFGNYTAQIDHLKGWVTLRAEWIDQQFLAAPTAVRSGNSLVFTAPQGAQLAYTLDGSDPRSLGGEIAPNATVSSSPVTIQASANVHIRCYRADLKGVFPGSPWSSSVGGDASSPLTPPARLVNISSRAVVGTGESALIAGVVVADTESKRYLARAIGPGLAAFGTSGTVTDPQLSIFNSSSAELFRNNGWETGPDSTQLPALSRSVGAFALAAASRDSSLAPSLPYGNYTVQVTTPSGRAGVGLAELYELDGNGRTVNLSTRAQVRTGDGVLIGGFVVQGPAYKRMLIRAVGPTLAGFGVAGALLDPILTVYSGQTVVATNDRWQSDNATVITAASSSVGAFALAQNSQDAALLITLPPGGYTVEVKGKSDTQGVALLEIYEVP